MHKIFCIEQYYYCSTVKRNFHRGTGKKLSETYDFHPRVRVAFDVEIRNRINVMHFKIKEIMSTSVSFSVRVLYLTDRTRGCFKVVRDELDLSHKSWEGSCDMS